MNWCILKNVDNNPDKVFYYAISTKRKNIKSTLLHRFIMDAPKDMFVDHKDHNTFDNRKSNLRIATNRENNRNSEVYITNRSGVPGVYWLGDYGWNKWRADIRDNEGKRVYLGYFDTFEQAKEVRLKAEIEVYGEYRYKANN